uniref:ADP-ribosylation factor-like protein 13B n=2 Tax=Parascaris univalens TaxID=6257 RepID=A0A915ACM1_PARUN
RANPHANMGNCVGGFKSRAKRTRLPFRKTKKVYLCVLGVDGAGKSTFVKALASEDITGVLPTNGFTLSEFKYKKTDIVAYDLGGGERIRAIWKNYYPEVFGLIYVIDGSDECRLDESSEVLKDVMSDENLRGKPILVLVNKKDRSGCIDEIQLSDRFCLHDLANLYTAQIRVEVCSANQGTGNAMDGAIKDGFEWLLERIFDDFDRLEKGVNEALKMLKQKQEEERIRRQHRLAAALNRRDALVRRILVRKQEANVIQMRRLETSRTQRLHNRNAMMVPLTWYRKWNEGMVTSISGRAIRWHLCRKPAMTMSKVPPKIPTTRRAHALHGIYLLYNFRIQTKQCPKIRLFLAGFPLQVRTRRHCWAAEYVHPCKSYR